MCAGSELIEAWLGLRLIVYNIWWRYHNLIMVCYTCQAKMTFTLNGSGFNMTRLPLFTTPIVFNQ